MNRQLDRRTVLKLGGLGLLACVSYTVPAFGEAPGETSFVIDESPRNGCAHCGRIMRRILSDRTKKQRLASFFPAGSSVTIYTKAHPRKTKVGEHALSLGNCSRGVQHKTAAHVPGCGGKKITVSYVYSTLVRALEANAG